MHVFGKICHVPALMAVLLLLPLNGVFAASLVAKPEVSLKQAFPEITVDSIEETDIKGLFEVVSGQNVYYYFPEKDYIFVGDIYTKEKKSKTAEKKREITSRLAATLPLDKAVKVGNGKKKVIEITDPDCPFCKKASEFFKNRTDVTRYVFFAPLAHPAAIEKIYYVLNAKDQEKAYHEMMAEKSAAPAKATYSDAIKALAQEHLALSKMVGVQGTPTFFVNGTQVTGADIPQLERLLKDPEPQK
jgi:thiol:disulfide interchange protein DsbC